MRPSELDAYQPVRESEIIMNVNPSRRVSSNALITSPWEIALDQLGGSTSLVAVYLDPATHVNRQASSALSRYSLDASPDTLI